MNLGGGEGGVGERAGVTQIQYSCMKFSKKLLNFQNTQDGWADVGSQKQGCLSLPFTPVPSPSPPVLPPDSFCVSRQLSQIHSERPEKLD